MIQRYSVNQQLIRTLLHWVEDGEIAIPEIQRPFVWQPVQVRDFLDSLYQGYPVGYIIVWKNPDIRLKDGSISAGKKILIDGQQRITALTSALLGQRVLNKDYKFNRIRIAFNPKEERFAVTDSAIEKDKEWIPDISPLMKQKVGLIELIKQYQKANEDTDERQLEKVFTRLAGITMQQIGVIELSPDLDIETVTEIFIRINREGVSLSQADFAMSKIAASEQYEGHILRKAIDYFCHLAVAPEFHDIIEERDPDFAKTDYFKTMRWLRNENSDLYDPSYSDMLRVAYISRFARGKLAHLVSLLSGRNFETRTYEEAIAERSFALLREGVLDFMKETHFKRFLMIIQSAGFIDSSLLRGRQGALNFAYALYLTLKRKGYEGNDIEHLVRRWFVLSILTGRYSGQVETRFEQDIRQAEEGDFKTYLSEIEAAELAEAFWNVRLVQNLRTSNMNHPAFKCFIAAQVKNQARAFLSKDITVRSLVEYRGDIHHIFPKSYLKNKLKLRPSEYNQVANLVYTQSEINIAIGATPPEIYLQQLRNQCSEGKPIYGRILKWEDMLNNMKENAIPQTFLEGELLDYNTFLDERRKLIATYLREYYFSL